MMTTQPNGARVTQPTHGRDGFTHHPSCALLRFHPNRQIAKK